MNDFYRDLLSCLLHPCGCPHLPLVNLRDATAPDRVLVIYFEFLIPVGAELFYQGGLGCGPGVPSGGVLQAGEAEAEFGGEEVGTGASPLRRVKRRRVKRSS